MRGLKRRRSARIICAGHAFVQNLRRGHYELATDVPARHRIPTAFDQLAVTSWQPMILVSAPYSTHRSANATLPLAGHRNLCASTPCAARLSAICRASTAASHRRRRRSYLLGSRV
jgi:hypothetical protein